MCSRNLFLLLASVFSLVIATSASAQSITVVEYYNKSLDAHFITGRTDEQTALDGVADFKRTGMTFQATAVATATSSLTKICRFYISVASPYVSSHFYGRQGIDCESIRAQNLAGFTWEDYDFATQQPTSGACPAGTTTIFRGFRAAAGGKTSNHRYSASQATYDSAVTAGYVGEGAAFCATAATAASANADAVATAVGTPNGTPVSLSIGAAGGSLTSADGKMTLTVPANAVSSATTFTIQPITNEAPGGAGGAYRLLPDGQTFASPVKLDFAYNDQDLRGTDPDALGVAFQDNKRFWRSLKTVQLDQVNRKLTVSTSHFSDWTSRLGGLQLLPGTATVAVGKSISLLLVNCKTGEPDENDLVSLLYICVPPFFTATASGWAVNGAPGGVTGLGLVARTSGISATYTAPATKPTPRQVAVSAQAVAAARSSTVVSNITIVDDEWVGTGTSTSEAHSTSAQVTWKLESSIGNVATYRPSGTATMILKGCIFYAPDNGVIDPNSGVLKVDYNASPPTYQGVGLAVWPTLANTSNCPPLSPPSFSTFAATGYFGGSKGALGDEAQGEVSADGMTIEGTDTNTSGAAVTFNWRFTRK
ncbi:MAG: hypothetical protein ABIZ64_18515 [Casimicrobium sp.]